MGWSRSDHAAERRLMVAVGFSPRKVRNTESRRVATLESFAGHAINRSGVATRRPPVLRRDRGLKPTATIESSLCDEKRPMAFIIYSGTGQSLVRYTLPSKVLARERRLALPDELPQQSINTLTSL